MDKKRVKAEAALLPGLCELDNPGPQGLQSRTQSIEGLDKAFDWLVKELTRIANASTPRRKPNNGFQAPWWTNEVQQKAQGARKAERTAKAVPTAYNKAQLNQRLWDLSKAIRQARIRTWRSTLQEASHNESLL
jgi:hypothetical protein